MRKLCMILCLMLCFSLLPGLPAQAGDDSTAVEISAKGGADFYFKPGGPSMGKLWAGQVFRVNPHDKHYMRLFLGERPFPALYLKRSQVRDLGYSADSGHHPTIHVTQDNAPMRSQPAGKGLLMGLHMSGALGLAFGESKDHQAMVSIAGKSGFMPAQTVERTGQTGQQYRSTFPVIATQKLYFEEDFIPLATAANRLSMSPSASWANLYRDNPDMQQVNIIAWAGDYAQLESSFFIPKRFLDANADHGWHEYARVAPSAPSSRVNLRGQPADEDYNRMGRYFSGVRMQIYFELEDWYFGRIGHQTGYMQKAFLRLEGEGSQPADLSPLVRLEEPVRARDVMGEEHPLAPGQPGQHPGRRHGRQR